MPWLTEGAIEVGGGEGVEVNCVYPVKMLLLGELLAGDVLLVRPSGVQGFERRLLHQAGPDPLLN